MTWRRISLSPSVQWVVDEPYSFISEADSQWRTIQRIFIGQHIESARRYDAACDCHCHPPDDYSERQRTRPPLPHRHARVEHDRAARVAAPARRASPYDQRHLPTTRLVDGNTAVAWAQPPGDTGAQALRASQVRDPVYVRCRHKDSPTGYWWRRPSWSCPPSIQDHRQASGRPASFCAALCPPDIRHLGYDIRQSPTAVHASDAAADS